MNSKLPMVPRVVLVELAKQVDHLLKKQTAYFKNKSPTALAECRDLERRLKLRVGEILTYPDAQPTMFAEEQDVGEDFVALVVAIQIEAIQNRLKDARPITRSELIAEFSAIADRLRRSVPRARGGAA
jgi:hypothetical protein